MFGGLIKIEVRIRAFSFDGTVVSVIGDVLERLLRRWVHI